MAGEAPPVYLLDASIYIFRAYYSLPDRWWSYDGRPTAAVYGYGRWLAQLLGRLQPERVAACFDESLGTCFRNDLYLGYKCSRALPDESLAFQLAACRQITEMMGISCYASTRYEADDLIGTIAARARKQGRFVNIISCDKDLAQLLQPGDLLWDFPEGEPFDVQGVAAKFGVMPQQVPDFLALVGDAGDDIPGVPGVGPKTAAALLAAFGSLPAVLADIEGVAGVPVRGAARLGAKLAAHAEQLMLMRQVATVVCDAPLGTRLRLKRQRIEADSLAMFAEQLGLGPNIVRLLA